jgi:glycosyltransferase involved in cell wall biosynthesis
MIKPLLSIICITYNHEKFIAQAIDGFLLQKTSFPIEIIIHDDCSTDDTQKIVKKYIDKYPELIKSIFQKDNQYSLGKKIQPIVLPYCQGKYIAFCEGDDYWTDPNKLQKQVNFLEKNSDYVFCYTRFKTLDNKSGKLTPDNNQKYFHGKSGIDFNFEIFDKGWHIGTQTIVYNKEALLKNNHFENKYFRDTFLISDLLSVGKAYCLSEFMAVYRIHEGGIYSSTNELERAETGALVYKEIYKTYSNNKYLKSKYLKFTNSYIKLLINHELYKKALYAADELTANTSEPESYKEDLFKYIENFLLLPEKEIINKNNEQIKIKNQQLSDIKSSLSFKIGRAITSPLRFIKNLPEDILLLKEKIGLLFNKNKRELKRKGVIFIDKKKIIKDSKKLKPLRPLDPEKNQKLVVSLTSFPERIPDIFFNLYSLLNQTMQPDMLVLWLAEEQFPNKEKDLPKRVLDLQKYGLTIKWCKDIKSYKKLIFSLKEFPNDIIVTADDDIYYPENWLELLYNSYLAEPQNIHCHRAHKITFNTQNELNSYNEWPKCITNSTSSYLNFFTGAGGVLYPPKSLYKDILNEGLFMQLCPTADDIWFWAMTILNNNKIRIVNENINNFVFVNPELEFRLTDAASLYKINLIKNDEQLEKVFNYYNKNLSISPFHSLSEN